MPLLSECAVIILCVFFSSRSMTLVCLVPVRSTRSSHKNREMPYRHYSPEALTINLCTQLGDVWSFGILLWELMTDAKVPYPNCHYRHDIAKLFCAGYRFELPANTPEDLKSIFMCYVCVSQKKRKPMTELNTILEEAFDITPIVSNTLLRKEKEFLHKTSA